MRIAFAGISLVLCALATPASAQDPVNVTMETNKGTMKLELYPDKAPVTVENFVQYAKEGFYDGTVFHRVIRGFMIQGGGFTKDLVEKETRETIENEAGNGLKNDRYTIAMARKNDPHSASSQFFINHASNPNLNRPSPDGYGYTVFGKVVEGTDVIEKIARVPTETAIATVSGPPRQRSPLENVPVDPVVIEKVTVEGGSAADAE